jgi:hypothetical protein
MTIPVVPPKLRTKRDTIPVDVGCHITRKVDPGRATSSDSGRIIGLNVLLATPFTRVVLVNSIHTKTHTTFQNICSSSEGATGMLNECAERGE